MVTAEHREPCESRGSRTVLGEPGGESPPGYSTPVSRVFALRSMSVRKLPCSAEIAIKQVAPQQLLSVHRGIHVARRTHYG